MSRGPTRLSDTATTKVAMFILGAITSDRTTCNVPQTGNKNKGRCRFEVGLMSARGTLSAENKRASYGEKRGREG